MDADEITRKKQKLVEQMKKTRLERGIERNPSQDHAVALKTLQNPLRRDLMKFLIDGPKTLDQIKDKYDLNDLQAKLNLNMLEDSFFIEKADISGKTIYELTIRGEAFLENVKTVDIND